MLIRYLIEIKHNPKYRNGAYRKFYYPFHALNASNAIKQAIEACKKADIDVIGFDVAQSWPVNRKEQFKILKKFEKIN